MNKQNLTPAEFNQLQKDAIQLYMDAVWNLADLFLIARTKFGRKNLLTMTSLPANKVDWLTSIAALPYRNDCLPEVHYEVVGHTEAKKWLTLAKKDNLKPTQLRKLLRAKARNLNKVKPLKVSQWARSLMIAEMELQEYKGNSEIVKEKLKPLVALYNALNE